MNIRINREKWDPVFVIGEGNGGIEVPEDKLAAWRAAALAFELSQREMAAALHAVILEQARKRMGKTV